MTERAAKRLIAQYVTYTEVWSGNGYNREYVEHIDREGLAKAIAKKTGGTK